MPHIEIIIGKLEALKGNATSGSTFDLLTATNAVDDFLHNGDPNPTQVTEMNAKLDEVEEAVVDGTLSSGVLETFDTLTTELNALLS